MHTTRHLPRTGTDRARASRALPTTRWPCASVPASARRALPAALLVLVLLLKGCHARELAAAASGDVAAGAAAAPPHRSSGAACESSTGCTKCSECGQRCAACAEGFSLWDGACHQKCNSTTQYLAAMKARAAGRAVGGGAEERAHLVALTPLLHCWSGARPARGLHYRGVVPGL